jgi:hypothetical protein
MSPVPCQTDAAKGSPAESNSKKGSPCSPPQGDYARSTALTLSQEETIYAAYPKQVGKPAALGAIRRQLAKYPFEFLLARTERYRKTCNSPAQFIPNPSTWFNQERFNDDPATWRRTERPFSNSQPAIIRPEKFGRGVSKL